MKSLLVIYFFLFSTVQSTAQTEGILRFHVKSTMMKVRLEDNSWSEWREFGNMNQDMNGRITLDITKKMVYWDVRFKNNDGGIHVYKIVEYQVDSSKDDFGFHSIKMKWQDEKKKILDYEILAFKLEKCFQILLIDHSPGVKTKSELEPENN
jgi:hypothetical protein